MQHPSVALGSILVNDVVAHGKLRLATWHNVGAITNGALRLQALYAPYCPPLKTLTTQRSKMNEFVGGTCDWRPDGGGGAADDAASAGVAHSPSDFAKLRSKRVALGAKAPGSPTNAGRPGSSPASRFAPQPQVVQVCRGALARALTATATPCWLRYLRSSAG